MPSKSCAISLDKLLHRALRRSACALFLQRHTVVPSLTQPARAASAAVVLTVPALTGCQVAVHRLACTVNSMNCWISGCTRGTWWLELTQLTFNARAAAAQKMRAVEEVRGSVRYSCAPPAMIKLGVAIMLSVA